MRNKRYYPICIDTKSPSYARMVKAGFSFEVDPVEIPFSGYMVCVCGTREFFSFSPKLAVNNKIDVAKFAEDLGSAGLKHLKDDGYSIEQIANIRKAFI